ncbi:MAG: hypothetical protein J5935_01565 [Lachnospiraceae bacterium]|nr:hypothetical protein [Lachnospiraceae bacterium]
MLRRFVGVKKTPSFDAILFCETGMMAAGVYAQWFSLFHGVGAGAFFLYLILTILSVLFLRNAGEVTGSFRERMKKIPAKGKILVCVVIAFYAYGTARGYIHTDTTLYHAQSIHWIESFGSVKGLALLHNRFGYNSASFALSALFSFSWLTGRSFHAVAGFCALLLMLECLKVFRAFGKASSVRAADFVRAAGIYYLLNIYDEMVSPASDYFMVCTAFYLLIRALETEEDDVFSFGILGILTVWCATVKLSAAPLALLLCVPVCFLFREKQLPVARTFLSFAGSGLFIGLPFLIRNVLLTGYLLYPYPAIDLFSVPWKIDPGYALSDQREIMVWGRGYTDVYRYDAPLSEWAGDWFFSQSRIDQAALLLTIAGAGLFLGYLLYRLFVFAGKKDSRMTHPGVTPMLSGKEIFLSAVVLAGTLFWFRAAPLMRYGCVYVYTAAALTAAFLCRLFGRHQKAVFCAGLLFFLLGKGILFTGECIRTFPQDGSAFLLLQKDYVDAPCVSYEIDGETFYHANGAGTGYVAFPSSPFPADIRLLGEDLSDGFLPGPVSE